MAEILAHRSHEFHMGHRVYGHEGKCKHCHGHAYVITLYCHAPTLDELGRIIDFSVIKSHLVNWIEDNWDHKFMVWNDDPLSKVLGSEDAEGTVVVPFNPTAENIADWFLNVIGPKQLEGTRVSLVRVELMETGKCGVVVSV